MIKNVTCKSIGVYEHAIKKGNKYEVLDEKNGNYRIIGDHGRRIWISKFYFIDGIIEVPLLVDWKLGDDINSVDFVDVTFTFSDGSNRWAIISTPEKLHNHFQKANVYPPGFNTHHLIIIRSFAKEDVEMTFRYFDQQGELEKATLPLDHTDNE